MIHDTVIISLLQLHHYCIKYMICTVLYMSDLYAAILLTCSTPLKAEMDYFRGGVSQTYDIGNTCLIYILLMY
jgi:hypothetical protein